MGIITMQLASIIFKHTIKGKYYGNSILLMASICEAESKHS